MIGQTIAHYEILGKLGEGGMGVVYEALDRHLDRHIALKILPPEKVADPARKQRFIQEAKAASALNHPGIVTIHDIDEAGGVDYIAMELVPGRTLEELLARRRPSTAEALRYAVQIAGAMAAAHGAGIVHRDLKPANVMVTDSGLVKILDFGLAKLTDESQITEDDATRTERAMTEEGTVMGSAPYMSPEQTEGQKVDARSDIFSFGSLLYEMLSGRRAFRAETRMKTMAAILNAEPQPLGELAPGLPKELERIVARCLRKDLARRSRSMAEIEIALEELKEESESGTSGAASPARKPAGRRRWLVAAGAVLTLAGALVIALPRLRQPGEPLKEVPLTSYTGYQGSPALSPDGNQFAFAWDGGQEVRDQGDAGSAPQLYVSLIGHGTPVRLTNTPGREVFGTAWSPDGQTIAFIRRSPGKRNGDLVSIPALGGPERKMGEAYSRPAWSPDGKWLYFSALTPEMRFVLFVQPAGGGETHRLVEPQPAGFGDYSVAISPDGTRLVVGHAFSSLNEDLFVADLRDGDKAGPLRQLTTDHLPKHSPVWTPDGRDILYVGGEYTSFQAV